jgi:hypothetical protein
MQYIFLPLIIAVFIFGGCGKKTGEENNELGARYERGDGVKMDYEKAAEFYKKACDSGEYSACANLANLYEIVFTHSAKNSLISENLAKKACDHNIAKGCAISAYFENDPLNALKLANKACDANDADGCHFIGIHYRDQDLAKSERFFAKAVELAQKRCGEGYGIDCYIIGAAYDYGTKSQSNKSLEYYERACDAKVGIACDAIGFQYLLKGDTKSRTQYEEKACEYNFAYACSSAADTYKDIGIEIKALMLHEQGCDLGEADDCIEAADMHANGFDNIAPNPTKADKYYKRAIALEQSDCGYGLAFACQSLGDMYMDAKIAQKDLKKADEYYKKAFLLYQNSCNNGDSNACASLDKLKSKMNTF